MTIIQLPYQYKYEPVTKYRERRRRWGESRGWITAPEDVIPAEKRKEVGEWQERHLPLFIWSNQDRSA